MAIAIWRGLAALGRRAQRGRPCGGDEEKIRRGRRPAPDAWDNWPHVESHPPHTYAGMFFDIDEPDRWEFEVDGPCPNWQIRKDGPRPTYHVAYTLEIPVARHDTAQGRIALYYRDVYDGLSFLLGADPRFDGVMAKNPLLAIAAGTGDVLMARLREGRANTARGAAHFLRETVGRVRYAGARVQLTVRADSGFYTHAIVAACRWMDVRFSITIRQHARLRNIIEAIPQTDWTPIPYWMDGAADVAETTYVPFESKPDAAPVRLIVRRVKPTPGSQLALFTSYSYHAFITDREGDTLDLEADHRRHAEIENAIRDLKYGVGLNHLPSGRFPANGAWLAVQVIAHNLARWTARIGLGEQLVTTKTLRRRFFSLAGRLTRSARRLTLHLPQRWPWENQFSRALARLRALPLPA